MPRRSNRCKSTMDTSSYYSKKIISIIIDPYVINTLLFIFIFCPIFIVSIIALPLYLISCKTIVNSYTFCLKQHTLIIQSNYRLKGVRGVIFDSTLIYAFQSFMIIYLSIDLLLFPEIKSIEIKSPVFITGCARSGTTFIHRILTTPPPNKRLSTNTIHDSPYVIHTLWEILCPSITLKSILCHFIHIMDKLIAYCGGYNRLSGAYDYKLNSEAAEEGLFGMHCMAGDFWVEFLPVGFCFDVATKYIGVGVKDHWRKHIVLLKCLLQRQIYWTEKTQIVAKSPSLCWFLEEIINEFPDCKILLLVRDPYEMICSNLALFHDVWMTLYGDKYMNKQININNDDDIWLTALKSVVWRRSEQSKRYMDVLNNYNGNKNILVIRYEDIKCSLLRCTEKCFEHCGLEFCDETKQWIQQKESKQKSRKRTHKIYSIASYGLDPEQTKQSFSDVIGRWNFQTEWK